MKPFEFDIDRTELRKKLGSMSQLAGVKRYRMTEGRANGLEAVDVRTGSGLEYTILPGRGMDIAWTGYKGVPISYISNAEVCAAAFYEASGMEWLRGFYAGMLTTCGFENVGGPCEDVHPVIGSRDFGLHGRLSYIPATQVSAKEAWIGNEYAFIVEGVMRESIVHGENLTLRRTISSKLGGKRIAISDVIENESNRPQPIMLLYHMNIGWPILDDGTILTTTASEVSGATTDAQNEIEKRAIMTAPVPGMTERCYFHKPVADADGIAQATVFNHRLGMGVRISFRPEQLPCLTEWKMLNEGEYVLGIEPGTTFPIGRANGNRQILQPGETKRVEIDIDILDEE